MENKVKRAMQIRIELSTVALSEEEADWLLAKIIRVAAADGFDLGGGWKPIEETEGDDEQEV